MRHFFIDNALHWLREYHIDGLRLDAVHEIYDASPRHLLAELADEAQAQAGRLGRRAVLIAEGDNPRLIEPRAEGGYGLDGHWTDDFHHAVHVILTGERISYLSAFGELAHLARAYRQAYVFARGSYTARERAPAPHPGDRRPEQFIVCVQNHDQVGNRAVGDRLGDTLSLAQLRLAAGAMLLSPFTPLIFMGEEYAEPAPFQFFTDHGDPELVRGVREGRKIEFAAFVEAHGQDLPDPQDPATFARSKLDHGLREAGRHKVLRDLYRELLRLRRELPALRAESLDDLEVLAVDEAARTLSLIRRSAGGEAWLGLNFGPDPAALQPPDGDWLAVLDSAGPQWADPDGPPADPPGDLVAAYSFRLLARV